MYNQAYNAYQTATVRTASQGQLVVLLYEGAVRELTTATSLFGTDGKLKAHDIEKFGNCLQKTGAIITELEASLDMEKGGEVAENLMSLYTYFNSELMDAAFKQDKSKVDFVLNMMTELTVSWRQIAASTANVPVAATVGQTLNIEG